MICDICSVTCVTRSEEAASNDMRHVARKLQVDAACVSASFVRDDEAAGNGERLDEAHGADDSWTTLE